ncbi:protein lava lamp [Agrilus planipennis]|uniref:Protein lava lamp n=1 Tax=Agrilus planipennis TaxID=224129 RepID=A0A1W4WU01_AGRPL|nr:protein lava lamp [Agrilus planipennis]XP_018327354.1 protein lava lamp [Agrilus planipennis]
MWKGSEMDSSIPEGGGTSSMESPPQTQELIDLKDQYEQQQVLISQLKEMLRKNEQTTVTPEKVEEYANTLNRMRAKAKQGRSQKQDKEHKDGPTESRRASTVNIQAKEKILLLRQKVEENKAKLAKRDKDHKGLEEMVIQLKAQLDDSQQFIHQTSMNLSVAEPKVENLNSNSSSEELYNALLLKEKRIADLNNKVLKLEANVLDLQENLKEKDSVIDARTKAITLMSENMSKKSKVTVDELEDTKEQMKNMQANFVALEMQLNNQKQSLLKQLKEKNNDIEELSAKNVGLEDIIKNNEEKIKELESQGSASIGSQNTKKGKKNTQLQNKIAELEKLLAGKEEELKDSQKQVENLQTKIEEATDENKILINKLMELEKEIEKKQAENESSLNKVKELEDQLKAVSKEETIRLLEQTDTDDEVKKLKKQLDEYNKNMIKVKAQHKSKLKELNKKLDDFKKISDVNAEIVKLHIENAKLKQQLSELESTKGDSVNPEKETFIAALRAEIQAYQEEVATLKDQLKNLSVLENAQVTSEINNIHLEERIDNLEAEKRKLEEDKQLLTEENLNLLEKIEDLKREKLDVSARLDQCLQENMDLIDKLDKLSAEKVSSAESIEIVDGLTQQEKLELEAYQKSLETTLDDSGKCEEHLEQNVELNESVNQLTEETSDLLRKIELFTEERREVMEKMESITTDNNQLQLKIKEIENNRDILAETYEQLQNDKEKLDNKLEELESENAKLKVEIEELKSNMEVKHGNIVEETINLEKVAPLHADASQDINKKLQEEIVEYKSLIEIQKQEIKDLKLQLLSSNTSDDLKQELANLELQYEALLSENQKLKEAVKTNSELVHEKDSIEEQLRDAKKKTHDLETKLTNALAEINGYKSELQEKSEELNSSNNQLTLLQEKIEDQQAELSHYESTINHLNSLVSDLTDKSNELNSLKEMFEKDMKHIEDYEEELARNSEIIVHLESELKKLNMKIHETEQLLDSKDEEIEKLKKERETNEVLIINLREEVNSKDEKFHKVCDQLREKCNAMQNQIEHNQDSMKDIRTPLEGRIKEMEDKNKEQLEKMKKLAANLKKKSLQCQELEKRVSEMTKTVEDEVTEKEKLQVEVKEKDEALSEKRQEVEELRGKLEEITTKLQAFEERENDLGRIQNENAQLRSQINQYIAINNDLQNIKTDYETQIAAFSDEMEIMRSNINNAMNIEITRKDEMINELNEKIEALKYNHDTSLNAAQVKIQELEMYIETQEAELSKYKIKANKLEEGLLVVEERRASLERRAIELGAQLEEKSHNYEEISHTEDILEQRLSALLIHDEIIEKRLQETTNENHDLSERNRFLLDENSRLREELSSASGKIVDVSDFLERISFLESENAKLTDDAINLENELKRLQHDLNKKLLDKEQELDALENELQNQIQINSNERKNLLAQSEHLQDQLKESQENQELLQEEINSYEKKLTVMRNDLQNTTAELQKIKIDNENNVAIIQQLQNVQEQSVESKVPSVASYFGSAPQQLFEPEPQKDDARNEELLHELEATNKILDNVKHDKSCLESKILEMEEHISKLNSEILNYKQLQAHHVSKQVVDEILNVAEKKVSEQEQAQTPNTSVPHQNQELVSINWGNFDNNDPFGFVNEEKFESTHAVEHANAPVPNVSTELEHKLKTLEFMLFNAEKERDEALAQCNQLTNELAELIYEKEQRRFSQEIPPQQLHQDVIDSGIVPLQKAHISEQDRKELQNIEFEPVHFTKTDGSQPVEEVVGPPKTAYLEYNPENDKKNSGQQVTPPVTSDIFENDDGWGWGPDEAKLEEERTQKEARSNLEIDTNPRIEQLEERIRVLELDRERHLEEIRQLQVKAGKLIKKVKELKNQNDKLTAQKSRTDEFGDLENTIQEELKSQISNLEKRIKEINNELDKERREKNNLLQRVDVLTASHERMLEMKEKQDIEMLGWQQRNRELASKLEQLEWGDGDHESPKKQPTQFKQQTDTNENESNHELLAKINELNETIKELVLDNEELQLLLEEQRNLRISLERSKSLEPSSENMKSEAEYTTLLTEHTKLKESTTLIEKELNMLKQELEEKSELEKVIFELQQQKTKLEENLKENNEHVAELQHKIQNQNKQLEDSSNLREKLTSIEQENSRLVSEVNSLTMTIQQLKSANVNSDELATTIEALNKEKSDLFNALQESNVQVQNLNDMLSEATVQILSLEKQLAKSTSDEQSFEIQYQEKLTELNETKTELTTLSQKLNEYEKELSVNSEKYSDIEKRLQEKTEACANFEIQLAEHVEQLDHLKHELTEKNQQLESLISKLETNESEYESKLATTIQQLTEEWSQRVDQRGTDVAESWKLHLESRETEFMQLEQQLRKEIFELESKFNVLVNENNELRRNVDAEIRNEVDRVSALQQQIVDGQEMIKQLTLSLETNQREIESLNEKLKNQELLTEKLQSELQEKNNSVVSYENIVKEKDALVNEKQSMCENLHKELEKFKEAFNENLHSLNNCQKELASEREMRYSIEKLNDDSKNYIQSISQRLEETAAKLTNANKTISALENQVKEHEERISNLLKDIQDKESQLNAYTQQNTNLEALTVELRNKDSVIDQMQALLSEKEREFTYILELKMQQKDSLLEDEAEKINALKQRLSQTETHYEEILMAKESDLQLLQATVQEYSNKIDEINAIKEQLINKEKECENLNKALDEQKVKLDGYRNSYEQLEQQNEELMEEKKQVVELHKIIEDQVLRIEDLKKQVFEKSKDYDSLIAEMEIQTTPRSSTAEAAPEVRKIIQQNYETQKVDNRRQLQEDDTSEPVSRAELDLALYMLHQRDVRCEELTLELTQLLEERDTLQLKLSNALREKEDLRRKAQFEQGVEKGRKDGEDEKTTASGTGAIPKSNSASATVLGATGTELAAEVTEGDLKTKENSLNNKLLELKSIGYRKDKTILDEQEQRRLQELTILQQYQDVGAMLPPEAAAKLMHDATYTLSRDVQSPSKVLLNWLWGRSTPKN